MLFEKRNFLNIHYVWYIKYVSVIFIFCLFLFFFYRFTKRMTSISWKCSHWLWRMLGSIPAWFVTLQAKPQWQPIWKSLVWISVIIAVVIACNNVLPQVYYYLIEMYSFRKLWILIYTKIQGWLKMYFETVSVWVRILIIP